MICDYGCGQEAKYHFKNGKWCCSKSQNSCPEMRRKNSESSKGQMGMYGKRHTIETKKKISKQMKGRIISDETRQKISTFQKGKIVSKQTKEKIRDSRKGKFKGKDNPNWKGGYHSKEIPTYDHFYMKLVEKCRRNHKDKNILEVRCSYSGCNKWFVPNLGDVYHRVDCLNNTRGMGESRLYCSIDCKKNCDIFGINFDPFKKKPLNTKFYTDSENQQFNEHVLNRDNYKCSCCGEKAEHVHHIRPQKLEPFFALDPDYAIAVCKKCHYKYCHKDECSTGNLAKRKCESEK